MPPSQFQTSLIAAERALGRLDAALADPAVRHRHRPDARHRATQAALRLDGVILSDDDLRLIDVAPDAVSPGARSDAALGAALRGWATTLDERAVTSPALTADRVALDTDTPPNTQAPNTHAPSVFAANGLRAALDGLAVLAGKEAAPHSDHPAPRPSDLRAPDISHTAEPWTLPWTMAALLRWTQIQGRRRPSADAGHAVAAVLEAVDRMLATAPGLDGALRVIVHLHRCDDPPLIRNAHEDPFENPLVRRLRQDTQARNAPAFWSALARLAAPALLHRACGLTHADLPLVISWAKAPTLFRATLAAPADEALRWLLDRSTEQAEAELDRLAVLDRRATARRAALRGWRRDAQVWRLLERLGTDPALTIRGTAQGLGCSERTARITLNALSDVGVLRPLPAWSDDPHQSHQRESARTTPRPLVWLATESPPERLDSPKPTRHRGAAMPPPGTAMRWHPIATAPKDGRRCLVWVGRPALARFVSDRTDAPPSWREGRRILTPTHWLPVAPPDEALNA